MERSVWLNSSRHSSEFDTEDLYEGLRFESDLLSECVSKVPKQYILPEDHPHDLRQKAPENYDKAHQ